MRAHKGRYQRDRRRRGRFLGRLGLGREPTAPALERIGADDFFDHADGQALLEAAELAAVPPPLIHGTGFIGEADVLAAFLDSPLEEPLAALAGADAVVLAGGGVSADCAELRRRRRGSPGGLASRRGGGCGRGRAGRCGGSRLRRFAARGAFGALQGQGCSSRPRTEGRRHVELGDGRWEGQRVSLLAGGLFVRPSRLGRREVRRGWVLREFVVGGSGSLICCDVVALFVHLEAQFGPVPGGVGFLERRQAAARLIWLRGLRRGRYHHLGERLELALEDATRLVRVRRAQKFREAARRERSLETERKKPSPSTTSVNRRPEKDHHAVSSSGKSAHSVTVSQGGRRGRLSGRNKAKSRTKLDVLLLTANRDRFRTSYLSTFSSVDLQRPLHVHTHPKGSESRHPALLIATITCVTCLTKRGPAGGKSTHTRVFRRSARGGISRNPRDRRDCV